MASPDDANFRIWLNNDGDNARRITQISGPDAGLCMSPQHVFYRKLCACLARIFTPVPGGFKVKPRLLEATLIRCFNLDPALAALYIAEWCVGPERWSQLFFDAVSH